MEAVLYICHGSRVKKAQEQALAFIRTCMAENPAPIQTHCYLEMATPTIEAAFKECVKQGATTISAIPVLLLTAGHAKIDIPQELLRLNKLFPEIKIKYGQPIGVHPAITDILFQRIEETNQEIGSDSTVLLVGRGSSDSAVIADLTEIANMLKKRLGIIRVEACFLAAANPSFETALQHALNRHSKKIFVIPYLLFSGMLMKKIEKTVHQTQHPTKPVILCDNLGYHPLIKNIVFERVLSAKVIRKEKYVEKPGMNFPLTRMPDYLLKYSML
jgi:sirohydrochlorin ferrochelatase